MAWAFGWEEAQAAAGSWWMPPFLGLLMQDSYDVVRYRAHRTLMAIPEFEALEYEFDAPPGQRAAALRELKRTWSRTAAGAGDVDGLLMRSGTVDSGALQELLSRRDTRVVYLQE